MTDIPTLESIAKACGVSHMTVSRALRGHKNVKQETADRIREYAQEVGYQPNSIARTLARSGGGEIHLASTRSIVVPYCKEAFKKRRNPLFWDYIEGAVQTAAMTQSSIEVIGFGKQGDEFDFIRALVENNRIAGVLDLGLSGKVIDYLLSKNVPVVSRLQSVQEIGTRQNACLYPDHVQGYVMAWRYLQSLGHTRLGFIGRSDHRSRLNECLAATHLVGWEPKLETIVWVEKPSTSEVIREALLAELGAWDPRHWPTVFFCSNDDVAHQTILALSDMNLSVPKHLSIFGFDDSPAAEFCHPPITTLQNPRTEIGSAMLCLLKNIIAGRASGHDRVDVLPMRLIKRKSVSRIN